MSDSIGANGIIGCDPREWNTRMLAIFDELDHLDVERYMAFQFDLEDRMRELPNLLRGQGEDVLSAGWTYFCLREDTNVAHGDWFAPEVDDDQRSDRWGHA